MGLSGASGRNRLVHAHTSLDREPVLASIKRASGSRLGRSRRPGSEDHDARRFCHRRHRVCLRQAHSASNTVRVTAYAQPVEQTSQLYVGDMLRDRMHPWRVVKRHVVPRLLIPVCATQPKLPSCILRLTRANLRLAGRDKRKRVKHNKGLHGLALLPGLISKGGNTSTTRSA